MVHLSSARRLVAMGVGVVAVLAAVVLLSGTASVEGVSTSLLRDGSPNVESSWERCGKHRKVKQGDKVIPCYGDLCKCTAGLCCNLYGFCGGGEQHCSKEWGCNWRFGKCSFPPEDPSAVKGPQYGAVSGKPVRTSTPLTITKIISAACVHCADDPTVAAFQKSVDDQAQPDPIVQPAKQPPQFDEGAPAGCPYDKEGIPVKKAGCGGSQQQQQQQQNPLSKVFYEKPKKPTRVKVHVTPKGSPAPSWTGTDNNKAMADVRDVLNPSGY